MGIYTNKAVQLGKVVDKKNSAYGDSFNQSGKILKILYPDGIKCEQYDDVLAIIRVIDKLFRIASNKDAFGENPWNDIAGYAILKSTTVRTIPDNYDDVEDYLCPTQRAMRYIDEKEL